MPHKCPRKICFKYLKTEKALKDENIFLCFKTKTTDKLPLPSTNKRMPLTQEGKTRPVRFFSGRLLPYTFHPQPVSTTLPIRSGTDTAEKLIS